MRAYVAGPLTYNDTATVAVRVRQADAFVAKALELEAAGHEALIPTLFDLALDTPWPVAMRECLKHLLTCDMIVMLPDWQQSRGARLEHQVAVAIGLEVACP